MITRRAFIAALIVSPGLARAGGLGSADADFNALLRQLGGVPDISPTLLTAAEFEFASAYGQGAARALTGALGTGALDASLARADEHTLQQVKFLTRFLYTGEVIENGVAKALYYPWCLAWKAVSFATNPGLCGEPFGHWADAPGQGRG